MSKLNSDHINKLLDILQVHQKGTGGGGKGGSGNPLMDFLSSAGKDISGAYTNSGKVLDQFLNKTVPNAVSPVTKGIDDALSNAPLLPFLPNGPKLGDVVAPLNKLASGDTTPGLQPQYKSVLAALPFLMTDGESPEETSADETTTGGQYKRMGGVKAGEQGPPGYLKQINTNSATNEPQYATGGQATTAMNPGSENMNTEQTQTKQPYKPYPDVPDEPAIVTDRNPIIKNPNTNGNPVQVDLSGEAKKNGYYKTDQDQAQDVLDKYVPGNTAQEVESALPKQLQEESQRIANVIGQNPQSVPSAQLEQDNATNMAKKGFTPGNNTKADAATQGLQRELYSQLNAGKNNIVPPNMTGEDLRDQINLMDQRLQSVYKKQNNNTSLTPEDTAALTYRQTLSNQLKKMYPDVSDALDRQSAMMKAIPSVADAAQSERQQLYKQATTPQSVEPSKLSLSDNLKAGIVNHPYRALSGILGLTGAGAVAGYGGYLALSQPKIYNVSGGNVTLPGIKNITLPSGDSLEEDVNGYIQGKEDIAKRQKANSLQLSLGTPAGLSEDKKITSDSNLLEQKYAIAKPIFDQYTETSNQLEGLSQAQSLLKNANPQWFSAFGGVGSQFTGLRSALVPGYASFEQSLNNLKDKYNIDPSIIAKAANPESANAAINVATKFYKDKLSNTIQQNGGVISSGNTTATGKDIIQHQMNQIVNTGSPVLDSILTPTPTQQPQNNPNYPASQFQLTPGQ